MDTSTTTGRSDETTDTEPTSLDSGTGAPIFEQGPTTRIHRKPVRAFAQLTWEDGPRRVFGRIHDVSLTGCLLKTETTIDEQTELQLSITLLGTGEDDEGDDEFDVRATVKRTTTVAGRRAYGLEFCVDSRDEKRAVQALYSATAR